MLTPSEITLEFARLVRRTIPVRVALSGKPAGELRIVETKVTPESVEVTGPQSHVDRIKNVETAPIDLAKASAGVIERNVDLESPREYMSFSASAAHVEILLEEPEISRVLKGLSIVVRNTEHRTSVTPEKVQLTVRGPRSAVQALEPIQGTVYIDASERAPGQYDVTPAADLPGVVEVVRWDPGSVRLQVKREKRK
jgi:YbbR domain-containing protein